MVRKVCDHAAQHGQTFALETGQEPAPVLLSFIQDVGPAEPEDQFRSSEHDFVRDGRSDRGAGCAGAAGAVGHCKDGDWPPKVEGALGTEKPLGQGSVGMERFIAKLKEIGYKNPLNIEREVQDQQQRLGDIRMGVELLERLR
jgi:L-ribulose-5-phosphate 3-epimerase